MNGATRLVKASLKIEFSKVESFEHFRDEFEAFSQDNSDPIGMWLKNLRARGKVIDENEPMLALLIELYRKVDELSHKIDGEIKQYAKLEHISKLESIGHSVLIFNDNILEIGAKYYARLNIAVFPKRKLPIYFEATDENTGEIKLMHDTDLADFDSYIVARERSIIRETKSKNTDKF